MQTKKIVRRPRPYKPFRCVECGGRPSLFSEDGRPIWRCACGAFSGAQPNLECKGRVALPSTHGLRAQAFNLFTGLVEQAQMKTDDAAHKIRARGYIIGSGIIQKHLAFGHLTAADAQKLIAAWSVP